MAYVSQGERWRCPQCGQGLTLFVQPTVPPRCHQHFRKVVEMKQEKP